MRAELWRIITIRSSAACETPHKLHRASAGLMALTRLIFIEFYRFLPMFRTFLGDFNLQKLPSGRLQTLWE